MKGIIKNTLILTLITLVSGILLGLVFEITKEPIKAAQEKAKQEAYQSIMVDAKEFAVYEEFDAEEAANILEEVSLGNDTISEVAIAKDANGEVMGNVITIISKEGYGGEIKLSVGILNDGTITGMEILSLSETAGLGMKATDASFKEQFKDKRVEQFTYTKTGASKAEDIDAISGATVTTSAVTNGVNAGLIYFQKALGGSDYATK